MDISTLAVTATTGLSSSGPTGWQSVAYYIHFVVDSCCLVTANLEGYRLWSPLYSSECQHVCVCVLLL